MKNDKDVDLDYVQRNSDEIIIRSYHARQSKRNLADTWLSEIIESKFCITPVGLIQSSTIIVAK